MAAPNASSSTESTMPRAAILTALPVEYASVRDHLENFNEEVHEGTVYESGNFSTRSGKWEVAIAQIGPGSKSVAVETERTLVHFNPDVILFVGVAGGIRGVEVGDVVVANEIYNSQPGDNSSKAQPGEVEVFQSSYYLVQVARSIANRRSWLQRIHGRNLLQSRTPSVIVGPVLSVDRVIRTSDDLDFYRIPASSRRPNAVEMEGRGFLQAALSYKRAETLIIRGIAEVIGQGRLEQFNNAQLLAARVASAFTFELLTNVEVENIRSSAVAPPEDIAPDDIVKESVAASEKIASLDKGLKLVGRQDASSREGLDDIQANALLRQTRTSRDPLRNYAIVQVLLQTGMRLDECSQLTLDDIELGERSGRVTIRQGKGNKTRVVPLNASARQALAEYVASRLNCDPTVKAVARAWPHRLSASPSAPLWQSQKKGSLTTSAMRQMIDVLVRDTAARKLVPAQTSAHTLRHTFARNYLAEHPGDIVGLASILGHTSLDTTRIYSQPTIEQLSLRVEQLSQNAYTS